MSSDAQRLARAQALLSVVPMVPPAGGQEILRNWLDALQVPSNQIARILPPEVEGQPSPQEQQAMATQQEAKLAQADVLMKQQLKAEDLNIKEKQAQSQIALNEQLVRESQARIQKMTTDAVIAQEALALDNQQKHVDLSIKAVKKMDDLTQVHQAELQKTSA